MENRMAGGPDITRAGGEGSNVIYVGKDEHGQRMYAHMQDEPLESEEGMRETVQGYNYPGHQDNRENYKFEARYAPKVGPWSH